METKETFPSLDGWSRQELKDILDFYINDDCDTKGGFYGTVLKTFELVKEAATPWCSTPDSCGPLQAPDEVGSAANMINHGISAKLQNRIPT